ncbi:cell division protein CrgA [Corynebacterium lowii]|uniref:Cell division protein CrgA n=1 Tax=Corynebacterium lowii TaxID=1544413 RepID=A0A0Q0UL76_9CORY|nr:cell division protein CrgA [Corynebacterium lowii]KQB87080.1 Cell division protein CrgA [Corynebacterium lowii]MDP9852336.1 hypothetical protein [Corynebacterium lowii]
MPKSKITPPSNMATSTPSTVDRTPVKINTGGTPTWYKVLMFGFMLLGLAWLVVNYLAGNHIPLMLDLGAWNYLVGFGLFIVGLLMTMGWR